MMKHTVSVVALIATSVRACSPEPMQQGKSYYQREAENQVAKL